ncbi:hypothetical protein LX99_03660 [Mucilaginibacter oryzae]|uniref:Uncharacterized protein n=1 Tax=Mucilaginibacter oryzae TaxID=468058 RepID=A0A316H6C7_9SPHI|nr:hypothetical protein [Mucilaginibacter oryzae]PWK75927.1 hypothetical protein LX99_03660 [Mucilaginibacter oryzae]
MISKPWFLAFYDNVRMFFVEDSSRVNDGYDEIEKYYGNPSCY